MRHFLIAQFLLSATAQLFIHGFTLKDFKIFPYCLISISEFEERNEGTFTQASSSV